ncbi:MAG: hypothetical protein ACKO96_06125, partial [Flammeovirgaceae bacterium]
LHKGYQAIVQTGKVTVVRDGDPTYEDTGFSASTFNVAEIRPPAARAVKLFTRPNGRVLSNSQKTKLFGCLEKGGTK